MEIMLNAFFTVFFLGMVPLWLVAMTMRGELSWQQSDLDR